VVDAGVGTASDACLTMEQGVDGILMNTALAAARDPVAMARAMRLAVEADARRTSPAACPNARWRCLPRRSKGCWIRDATAARRAALQMLDAVRGGATLQGARDGALANLMERDRRLAYELAAGVLRRRAQLDGMLELATADPAFTTSSGWGPTSCARLARVPPYAAVSTSVELAREMAGEGGARYVNRALRSLAREAGGGRREAELTHPKWLVDRWRRHFGDSEATKLLAWNDTRPAVTLPTRRVGHRTPRGPVPGRGVRGTRSTIWSGSSTVGASRLPSPASRATAGVRRRRVCRAGPRPCTGLPLRRDPGWRLRV